MLTKQHYSRTCCINVFPYISADQKSEFKVSQSRVASGGSGEESVSCLFPASGNCQHSLAFFGLWLHHSNLCVTFPPLLCVCQISQCLPFMRKFVVIFKAHPYNPGESSQDPWFNYIGKYPFSREGDGSVNLKEYRKLTMSISGCGG